MSKPKNMSFRTDINGLRALAVLSVLFYHFGVPGFGGGYVGVDVFFVISGFLMTQIISTKLDSGRFSLAGFYAARARRIVPALVAMTVLLLIGGWFFMTPFDYKWFGRHALAALTFTSNIVFSHKGDYFDAAIRESWLLHTWSLSVEWQFYLLFPLYLVYLRKFREGKFLTYGVPAVLALSLLLSAFGTSHDPMAAFYILPTRAWEFMAGGMAFLSGKKLAGRQWPEAAGLLMIAASVVFFNGTLDFPGAWAVLPVLGAALLIGANKKKGMLSSPPVQFFGTISYSLYLWHWPVLRASEYLEIPSTPLHIAFYFALSVLLAVVSYRLVETPFREMKKNVSDKKFLAAGIAVCAVFSLLSYAVFDGEGFMSRLPADVQAAAREAKNANPRDKECATEYKKGGKLPECVIGDTHVTPSVALWGDSHAGSIFTAVSDVLAADHRAGIFYGSSGCPPVLGVIFSLKWKGTSCKAANQVNYDRIMANPHIKDVLMAGRWPVYLFGYNEKGGAHQRQPYIVFHDGEDATADNQDQRAQEYADNIVATMCKLTAQGKHVYVMETVPELGKNVPGTLAKSRLLHHRETTVEISLAVHEQRNAVLNGAFAKAVKQCGIHVLDPAQYLCKQGICSGIREGRPLYFDDNHLSDFGNTFLKPLFIKALRR